MSERTEMLKKVQQLHFVLIDAGLYLNNAPDTEKALELFHKYQEMYIAAKQEYEDRFGPLCYEGINIERDGWSWIQSPWPWEVED